MVELNPEKIAETLGDLEGLLKRKRIFVKIALVEYRRSVEETGGVYYHRMPDEERLIYVIKQGLPHKRPPWYHDQVDLFFEFSTLLQEYRTLMRVYGIFKVTLNGSIERT